MPGKIIVTAPQGLNVVAIVLNKQALTWGGGDTFVPITDVSIIAHPVALARVENTCFYVAAFPDAIETPGDYHAFAFAVAAPGAITLPEVQAEPIAATVADIEWSGTGEVDRALVAANVETALLLAGQNSGARNPEYGISGILGIDLCAYDTPAHATLNDGETGLLRQWRLTFAYAGGRLAKQSLAEVV